jgi:2-polyprenyl-6-methoxyphenol hydroxylase-like FAD-dependent oxidoreductase
MTETSAVAPRSGDGPTKHALVLGASLGGLLAARALAESFDRVTVIDRDPLLGTGHRKGVPQSQHAHAILAKGREVLEELFPGLTADLTAVGALAVDVVNDLNWHSGPDPLSREPSDLTALALSRPALEDYIRGRVAALPNVDIRGGLEALALLSTADRATVTGAQLFAIDGSGAEDLAADLVVDATGRGNRGMTWLTELGYEVPAEDTVKAGISYATREYQRRPLPSGLLGVLTGVSPDYPYGAVALPMENDRWIVTAIGFAHDQPPTDVDGFDAYVKRLPIGDLHDLVQHARPLTEPKRFRVPASVRRRYERLARLPEGYLAFADALCAFNPIYGQGMTVAAVEATVLRDCLRQPGPGLPRRFYADAAKVIDIPWDMAVGGDLAFPFVEGRRTLKTRILNGYIRKLMRAAQVDPAVNLAFQRTVNLTHPPERLFAPSLLRRILFPRRRSTTPVARDLTRI